MQLLGMVCPIRAHKFVSAFLEFQLHYVQFRAQRMARNSSRSLVDIYGPFSVASSMRKDVYWY
jgi:hypothetical protein